MPDNIRHNGHRTCRITCGAMDTEKTCQRRWRAQDHEGKDRSRNSRAQDKAGRARTRQKRNKVNVNRRRERKKNALTGVSAFRREPHPNPRPKGEGERKKRRVISWWSWIEVAAESLPEISLVPWLAFWFALWVGVWEFLFVLPHSV